MSVSDRIKKMRLSKNYSQEYMASQLGISQRAYSKLENDEVKIDVEKLLAISKTFEINPSELLDFDSPQINNFTNNKTITNAVVNHYNKTQDELNQEIITILKSENEQLKEQIVQKDKQINELIILSKR